MLYPTHPDHPLRGSLATVGCYKNVLSSMDTAGVIAALVNQLINYMYDLKLLSVVLRF
jgi:hypothetical protein